MQGAANAAILASKVSAEMAQMLEAMKVEMAIKLDAATRELEELKTKMDTNVEVLKKEMHVVGDDVKTEVLNVKEILISLDSKVEALKEVQLNLGFTMRQATLDWQTDHLELKTNLCDLGEKLSLDFTGLEEVTAASVTGTHPLSEKDMQGIVETAVQAAMSQTMSVPLDESIRQAIIVSMRECSAPSNDNPDSDTYKQLQAIAAMLLQLKDDVKQVSSEISEVRVDLKQVNKILGKVVSYNSEFV